MTKPLVIASSFFLGVCAPALFSQCVDRTTTFTVTTTATRIDGNHVQLLNTTTIGGNYANKWQPEDTIQWFFNGTSEASSSKLDPSPSGPWSDSFSPPLQTYGPGTYSITAQNDAWSPTCGSGYGILLSRYCATYGGCSFTLPTQQNASISIQRPGRPDYMSGYTHYLWYLGGNATSWNYSAQTRFTPGAASGAPEQPTYVIVSGANELSLDCPTCANPLATATAGSSGCQAYDVTVKTSYNGFLSDAFAIFINRPWNLIAANDQYKSNWCDPGNGPWVYSCALYNGYQTRVNYTASGLCATDAPMSGYDANETLGSPTPRYTGENWPVPGEQPGYVEYTQWYDAIAVWNNPPLPAQPLCTVAMGVVPCIPPWANPGVGPHTLVQELPQSFFVGGWVAGTGARVQSDTQQYYTDSGWHTNIVTPNP